MTRWAFLTGEYPPDPGGVSDYTRLVACGLAAAGDEVRVYAPPQRGMVNLDEPGINVHRLHGRFGPRSLIELERLLLKQPRPDRILLQYVPHAFGFKAMNLPFAVWSAYRLPRVSPVWVMFHEVAFPVHRWPLSHTLLGLTTRVMARLIAGAADRVFVSVPAWGPILQRICPRSILAEWLPVPCTVGTDAEPVAIAAIRERFTPSGGFLVGHFGTLGGPVADLLARAVAELLHLVPDVGVLLIGRGSDSFRDHFVSEHSECASRVFATGELAPDAVSAYLRACDILLQPYPDGISSRRTTAMAALANGVAAVTNMGELSEPLWAGGAVVAAPTPDPLAISRLAARLLRDPSARAEVSRQAAELYRHTFALEKTVARLREAAT